MTDRELKRLSRSELLEMLIALSKENDALRSQLAQAQQQLADRKIALEACGSIAEAALQLNGVFEAAEKACAQYIENLQARSERASSDADQISDQSEGAQQSAEGETKE